MDNLSEIRDVVIAKLQPVREARMAAEEQALKHRDEEQLLEAVLESLHGRTKRKSRSVTKRSKPCARKADVLAVCRSLVKENRPISKADLESLAKYKLREENGFDLKGFSLRLAECLASDEFEIDADAMVTFASVAAESGSA